MALETSADKPVPVRTVAHLVGQWISRLGKVWVEGQVTQVTRRPGTNTAFLTLRDPLADISVQVTCARAVLEAVTPPLVEGQQVVVFARPDYYVPRGSISLAAESIRPVGLGELLARIEHLRAVLTTEGLFAAERKRALPFLPAAVGLVCGRAGAAERDVRENARRRWPGVRFAVREVAVQGPQAVPEVTAALTELDTDPEVAVIVIARGGGSVQDLLPFSDETLLRHVAGCRTPVVSAIGHEQDTPLLDLVADARASTPTDAAKLVVPDVAEETERVRRLLARTRQLLSAQLTAGQTWLDAARSRPVLADPVSMLTTRHDDVLALRERARRCVRHALSGAEADLAHGRARVRALSPAATLQRGYAVVQREDGAIVRDPEQVADAEPLSITVAAGRLAARADRRG